MADASTVNPSQTSVSEGLLLYREELHNIKGEVAFFREKDACF
tara:strand:- start:146 stop:274 length:129 start_codon:yes stop_codon:yes gene_type:complete